VQAGSGSAGAVVEVGPNGGGTTQVGADAVLPLLWSAAPATLGDRTHVLGSVFTNSALTKGSSVVISGTVTSAANTVLPRTVAWSVGLPATSAGPVTINASQSQSLSPGRFGAITVNSQGALALSTGFYFADSLTLNAGATITIDDTAGPVTLYVLSRLTDHGIVTGKTSSTPNFVLAFLGSSAVVFDSQFSGAIIAPRASVTYRPTQSSVLGGIFAQDVEIGAGIVLQSRPSAALAADIGGTGDPTAVSPVLEGLATLGTTTFAVFGYQNAGSQNVHIPPGSENQLSTPSGAIATPDPAPPQWFLPGTHPGMLVYPLTSSALTWTLGSHAAMATSSAAHLAVTSGPQGQGVTIGGNFVLLEPSPGNDLQGSIVPTTDNGSATTVGNTPVSFHVSSDGAAFASIPLWVSPGRANMEPTLSVTYNSRADEGNFAYKWNLTGIPEVTRCTQSRARDGRNKSITFDSTDDFCFDGNRLVLESGDGSDGSTYRLEHDIFARFILHQSLGPSTGVAIQPDTFEMRSKDGLIYTFGSTDATLAAPLAGSQSGDSQVRFSWAVHQVTDRSGNTVTFHYNNAAIGCSERYISEIDYTGSTTDGIDNPQRSVVFVTEPRPDVRTSYAAGVCQRRSVLFSSIQMYGPSLASDGSGTIVKTLLRNYSFGYRRDFRTELSSVTECDGIGVCKAPVTFNYSTPSTDYDPFPLNLSMDVVVSATSPTRTRSIVGTDLNGDGFDDLIYITTTPNVGTRLQYQISNGSPTGQSAFSDPQTAILDLGFIPGHFILPVDLDMDGLADLMVGEEGSWHIFHNDGGSPLHFSSVTMPGQPFGPQPAFGDIDGDGLPDMVRYIPEGGLLQVFRNHGGTFESTPFVSQGVGLLDTNEQILYLAQLITGRQTQILTAAPFTGQPTPRLLTSYTDLDDAAGTVTNVNTGIPSFSALDLFLDLNGDGVADAVRDEPNGQPGNPLPTEFLNIGQGVFAPAPTQPAFPTGFLRGATGIDSTAYVVPFDYDQDGFQDLVVLESFNPTPTNGAENATPGFVLRSVGDGTFAPEGDFVAVADKTLDNELGTIVPFTVLDFDGDGLPDLIGFDNVGTVHAYQHHGLPAGLLTGITDSIGKQTTVTYKPLRQVSPVSSGCSYPQYCVNQGIWFVSDTQTDNGLESAKSQTLHDQHTYAGAASDLAGRGWLGVASHTVQRFRIDAPTTTTPYTQSVTTYNNTTLAGSADGSFGHTHDYFQRYAPAKEVTTHFNRSNQGLHDNIFTRSTTYALINGSIGSFYYAGPQSIDEIDQDTQQGPAVPAPNRTTHIGPITYDAFGNISSVAIVDTLADGSTTTTTTQTTYLQDAQHWLISQPTLRTITSEVPADIPSRAAVRSWIFTPSPDTGLLHEVLYQGGLSDEQLDTVYGRDVHGLVNGVTRTISTGDVRTTGITYDDIDGTFPKQVLNALSQPTELVFHPGLGELVSTKDPNLLRTSRTYDGFGRLRSLVGTDNVGFQVHYEPTSVVLGTYQVRVTHDAGGEDITTFDDWNRQIAASSTDFTGTGTNNVQTTYDPDQIGSPATVSVPTSGAVTTATPIASFAYDSLNELTEMQPAGGNPFDYQAIYAETETTSFGPVGDSYNVTDDGRGRITRLSEGGNGVPGSSGSVQVTYTYGPFGMPHTIKDSKGNTTTFTFDASGRKTSIKEPDTGTTSFRWNGFGDLVQSTDADTQVVTVVPDPLGRTLQTITPDGVTVYTWDTSPNGVGQLGSTTSPDNVDCGYAYDSLGRLFAQTWTLRTGNSAVDGSYTVGVSYDGVGRPSVITYPSVANGTAVAIQRNYAPNGTLSSLQRVSTGEKIWTVTARTPRNQVSDELAANGVETTHDYDPATGLIQEIKSTLGSSTLRDASYSYDRAHRLQKRIIDGQTETFGYDVLHRLKSWEQGNASTNPGVAYAYDDLGNLLSRTNTMFTNHVATGINNGQVTFTPGDGTTFGPHQIATSSLGSYSYDPRGDQKFAPGRTTTFTNFGLPHVVSGNGLTTTFAYDATRERVLKMSGSTAIVSLGGLYERRVSSTQTSDVFYAVDAGRPVAQITLNETPAGASEQPALYLHDDHLGSIQMVTDSTGNIAALQAFDPFGARVGVAGAGVRIGFDGMEQDDEFGLINMHGRVYDPAQARFVSADPILTAYLTQGLNPYAFVRNNPLNARDPSGLDEDPDPAGTGQAAGQAAMDSSNATSAIAAEAKMNAEMRAAAEAAGGAAAAASSQATQGRAASALSAAFGAAAAASSSATSQAAAAAAAQAAQAPTTGPEPQEGTEGGGGTPRGGGTSGSGPPSGPSPPAGPGGGGPDVGPGSSDQSASASRGTEPGNSSGPGSSGTPPSEGKGTGPGEGGGGAEKEGGGIDLKSKIAGIFAALTGKIDSAARAGKMVEAITEGAEKLAGKLGAIGAGIGIVGGIIDIAKGGGEGGHEGRSKAIGGGIAVLGGGLAIAGAIAGGGLGLALAGAGVAAAIVGLFF